MIKKLLILIVVIALAAAAGYYFWYLPSQEEEAPAEQPNLTRMVEPKVVSPVNSFSNNSLWYGLSDGKIMQYDLNTNTPTEYPLPQVFGSSFKKIYWPRQGSDFIAVSEFEGDDAYNYFSFKDKRYYGLPKNISNLDWASTSTKIVIIWQSGDGKTYLVVSNPDASDYKILRELPWSDLVVKASPSTNSALVFRQNSPDPVSKIYLFDLTTGEYIETITEGRNTGAVWAPKGDGFVFTRLENGKNQVYYHHLASGVSTDLKLATSIDKIAFSQDGAKIYIAAMNSDGQKEDIWEYTIQSKQIITLLTSDKHRMRNLISIGSELFFLNQEDALYGYK